MKKLLLLALLTLFLSVSTAAQNPCSQGTPFKNCRACGTATNVKGKRLNVQKNRSAVATNPQEITVAQMRNPANNSNGTFFPNRRVWVKAFVASVVAGGNKESCNCKREDLRDVHINIIADPSELHDLSKYVIVEFTPRWEEKFGFDRSDYFAMLDKVKNEIEGKWVRFEGWMLYDYIHADQSKTTMPNLPTCPDDGQEHPDCNWRATPWEVHPVTKYTVQ